MSTRGRVNNGIIEYYDSSSYERVAVFAPNMFYDDFNGYKLNKYVAGENTSAIWAAVETVGAVALVANAVNGIVSCALTSADSAQIAALYFGDQLCFSLLQGLVFEARLAFHVLPLTGTETVQAVFGLAIAHNATLDSIATNAWFRVESGANTALLWETDNGDTDDDDNSTGITLIADTYNIYRIDATDESAVRFYVDGVLVGTSNMSTTLTASEALVQPYFNVSKAKSVANTGTGTIYIDAVRCWQKRS
jgi:hypothetical protein